MLTELTGAVASADKPNSDSQATGVDALATIAPVALVPFTEAHLTNRYVHWLNDSVNVRYSEQRHRKHTVKSCREYFEGIAEPDRFWAIETLDLGHVGNLKATVDPFNEVADLSILVGREFWGQGIGFQAWCLAIEEMRQAGMRLITAGTLECNEAMLAIMWRSGMTRDGRRLQHMMVEGRPTDVIYGAISGAKTCHTTRTA